MESVPWGMVIHTVTLSQNTLITLIEKSFFPSPVGISYKDFLVRGGMFCLLSLLIARVLFDLNLCMLCACCHGLCEFIICVSLLLCLEDAVSV